MVKIRELETKYHSIIMYIVFGVLTTLVNIVTYNVLYYGCHVSNVASNIAGWVLSVAFAFVTNKIWVFESKTTGAKDLFREAVSFTMGRLATGVMDLGIMYLMVDVMTQNAFIWKIISNVIVVILNYVISKLWVFKNGD